VGITACLQVIICSESSAPFLPLLSLHDPAFHLDNKNKRSFPVWIRRLGGRSLHTTRSIAHIFMGVVLNVSSRLSVIYVADLLACRLNLFISAVACRPVNRKLRSAFLVWLQILQERIQNSLPCLDAKINNSSFTGLLDTQWLQWGVTFSQVVWLIGC
jgi:hypothetical protein